MTGGCTIASIDIRDPDHDDGGPSSSGEKDARAAQSWTLTPSVLLALGLGSVLMLAGANWAKDLLISRRLELVHAVGEIATRVAVVHVWVEELVTGDDVDRAHIEATLKGSTDRLDNINQPGTWLCNLFEGDDSDMLAYAERADEQLQHFVRLSETRLHGFDQGGDIGIGSDIDKLYDAVFETLLGELSLLDDAISEQLDAAYERQQSVLRIIVLAWLVIVALAFVGIWTHERRRRAPEAALRQSEAQLFQAQKLDAIGRLAGGIAHDINNHLAAIKMQCEVIQLHADDREETASRIQAIGDTATKSATMIKRLLAFSRRQPVQPRIISANGVIVDLKRIIDSLVRKDIDLDIQLDDKLWRIAIDPSQLEQIVLNLVINACEAMPLGGRLTLRTCNQKVGARDLVCLEVMDSGMGMDKAVIDRMFEPFFTTKDRTRNTGLGLATIDGIARQNGGQVLVDSNVGEGTTFRILLPAEHGAPEAPASPRPSRAPAAPADHATLLLVDDDDDLRQSTGVMLRALGYTVHDANGPSAALALWAEHGEKIDLAVIDVIMPDMNGAMLAERLREGRADLPVLFVSSYTDDVIARHEVSENKIDFLSKPFSAAELVERLAIIRSRKGKGGSSAA